jgi:hypothetical protein
MLVLLALAARSLRLPVMPGSYPEELDGLLYGGARLLRGEWLHADFVTGQPAISQFLYALSAHFGSLRLHRLLILAVDAIAALLLARTLGRLGAAGWIPWRRASSLPLLAFGFAVVINQCVPEGAAGFLPHFANLFLTLALAAAAALAVRDGGAPVSSLGLMALGGWLGLAMATRPPLALPLLVVLALMPFLLQLGPKPGPLIPPLSAGLLAGLALPLIPCLLRPGGLAKAWAGSVLLPLLAVDPGTAPVQPLGAIVLRVLVTPLAGIPLGCLLVFPLGAWLASWAHTRTGRELGPDRRGGLVCLSLVFALLLLETLRRDGFQDDDLALLTLPLVVLTILGLGALGVDPRPMPRRLALIGALVLSLIWVNNIAVASVLHPPHQPGETVRVLEDDRQRLATYLGSLPEGQRGFTAPQDVALQRRLNVAASTRGIGPRWSLNQQHLGQHWASQVLGLPVDGREACAQLTASRNHHLVWARTDPKVANSLAFFRSCLALDGNRWDDLSGELGLASDEVKVFRRRGS